MLCKLIRSINKPKDNAWRQSVKLEKISGRRKIHDASKVEFGRPIATTARLSPYAVFDPAQWKREPQPQLQ
jgi:hypothetical protein